MPEKLMGREMARRERAAKGGNLARYVDEEVLGMGYKSTADEDAWDNSTTARPDTIDRKNRRDR